MKKPAILYFVLCFFLWVLVDFGTAGGFRISYFKHYGMTLAIFYLGYPLIFTFLIFRFGLGGWKLLAATLFAVIIVEIVFTRNALLMNFPVCLFGFPLALAVYAPLTYFPLWIVRGAVRRHLLIMVFLSLIETAVMCLTTFGSAGGN